MEKMQYMAGNVSLSLIYTSGINAYPYQCSVKLLSVKVNGRQFGYLLLPEMRNGFFMIYQLVSLLAYSRS